MNRTRLPPHLPEFGSPAVAISMPTREVLASFWRDWDRLSPKQQREFRAAVAQFIADFAEGGQGFHPSLRVKRVQGSPGVWEMSWASIVSDGTDSFRPCTLMTTAQPAFDRRPLYPDPVRRVLGLSICTLLLGVLFTPAADAALYRGGGSGIRVKFRVAGHKIIEARVVARLRCIVGYGRGSEMRYRRVRLNMASERFPIHIDHAGRFEEPRPGEEAPEEEGYSSEERLKGRVRSGRVTGRFAYVYDYSTRSRDETCRTGPFFDRAWSLRPRDEASFRARRRHPGR